jgi:hypothetical protein
VLKRFQSGITSSGILPDGDQLCEIFVFLLQAFVSFDFVNQKIHMGQDIHAMAVQFFRICPVKYQNRVVGEQNPDP